MAPKGNKKPAAKPAGNNKPAPKAAAKKSAPKPATKKASATKKAGSPKNGAYVKGLSFPGQSNETVAEAFAKCGKVTEVRLRHGKYALIFFENEAGLKKARELNNKVVKGQKVSVEECKKAKPTRNRASYCTSVWIGGLPGGATRQQLVKHFEVCGKVVKARVYNPKNQGFVYFENNAAAKKAVALDNAFSHGKDVSTMEVVPAQLQRTLEVRFSIRSKKFDAKQATKRYNRRTPTAIEAAEKKSAARVELRAAAKSGKTTGSGARKGSGRKGSGRKGSSKK